MSSIWVSDAQKKVYSKAKAIITATLKTKYPDIYITGNDETPKEPSFPTVYIHSLQPVERGHDIENIGINGILLTIEVEVTATKAQGMTVAEEVAYVALEAFKSMNFNVSLLPYFDNDGSGTKRMIARYSRIIGYNDILTDN